MMESFGPIRLLLSMVFVLFLSRAIAAEEEEQEELTIVTRQFERIPLHHALTTLEEIVKEERAIEDFCYKHFFDVTRKYERCQNDSNAKTETKEANDQKLCDVKASSCADLFNGGVTTSGTYKVQLALPSPKQVDVHCDMETDGGGWTVFLRRGPYTPHINFTRSWNEYAQGFGNLKEEFWLGNEKIHALTSQQGKATILRVDLGDHEGNKRYAKYEGVRVSSAEENYRITFGKYEGDAGDSLNYNQGHLFATYDKNDAHNCVKSYRGGWWWSTAGCFHAKLTGEYSNNEHARGVNWKHWKGYTYSLKVAEMKLRSESFDPQRKIKLC